MINVEFMSLTIKQRKVMLDFLDVDITKAKCHYCKEKVTIENVGIMPSLKGKGHTYLICDNILCTVQYIDELEKFEEGEKK